MQMSKLYTFFVAIAMAATLQAAPAQEARLLFTSLSPAGSPNSQFFNAWAKRVNEASQGTLRVEVRDGATLANFTNSFDRTMDDVVQIGWVQHAFVAGRFPLSEVTNLPFMSDNNVDCSAALWRLYKSGQLDSEYNGIVPIWVSCLGQAGLHFAKPVASSENLTGLKIRVNGKVPSQVVARLGGTPISIGAESMYEALQRGTLDGLVTSWSAFEPYKLNEVSFHHLEAPVGSTPSMFFMSKKKFDSLPDPARKILMELGGEAQSRAFGQHIADQGARARTPVASSPKHKLVELTPEQAKAWEEKMAPIITDWAKERTGGDKIVASYRSIYADVRAGR